MAQQRLTPPELEHLLAAQPAAEEAPPLVADSRLLRQLASLDRGLLARLMTERRCVPGEVVFREGDPGEAMYLISAGRVVVAKGDLLRSPTVLGYRGPGEVVGEMALLEDAPRSASIVAMESLRLFCIERASFQVLLNRAPAIGMSIMETLSSRLRASDNGLTSTTVSSRQLVEQVSALEQEKQHLLELQRVRRETGDLIVHDLRNPLGVIGNVLQMLEMVLPEDVLRANQELLDIANSTWGRMQRLVEALLDVARLESGEFPLRPAETDLGRLLEQAVRHEAVAFRSGEIEVCCDIPGDLPPVMADAEAVERVVTNLLDNAVRYTPAGGQVVLAAAVQPGEVVVSVSDTGPGIPAPDRQRVFERFARVGDGKPRGRRGFGLGLTFCRLAVEAHGGRIWVEPGVGGVGSRFAFTLPLAR